MDKRRDWRDVVGFVLLLAITGVALWLRWRMLDLKPMHHDEGVNAIFTKKLVEEFKYAYNPYYYHGPLLYFLTAPFVAILGQNVIGMRVAPMLFGTLAVPAFVLLKDRIGWIGVLGCALLMAIAPVEVYFSRTAIHEIYNGTFNVLLVGGFYQWWKNGKRWGFTLGAVSLACLFATKETTAITVAAMVPAIAAVLYLSWPRPTFPGGAPIPAGLLKVAPSWWRKVKGESAAVDGEEGQAPRRDWPPVGAPLSIQRASERLDEAMEAMRRAARDAQEAWRVAVAQSGAAGIEPPDGLPRFVRVAAQSSAGEGRKLPFITFLWTFLKSAWRYDRSASKAAVWAFAITMTLLFTSFFTHPYGFIGFFEAFFGWGQTGVEGKGHEKVWHYFINQLLVPYYMPMLVAGLPGLLIGSIRRDAFAMFNLVWLVLALAAYSIIPYKTPWCVISFATPLFFGVGITLKGLVDWAQSIPGKALQVALVAVPLGAAAYPVYQYAQESWEVQFTDYDVDGHAFIYVQNVREFMDLVHDMRNLLKALRDAGEEPNVYMIKSRNPLRWYVVDMGEQDWANKYDAKNDAKIKAADIIITQRSQAKDVRKVIKVDDYQYREYHERPGQKFEVFIKKPLWQEYLAAVERGEVEGPTAPMAKQSYSDRRTREMKAAKNAKLKK